MDYPLSRLMSAATATYGAYALAQPRHLGRAVDSKDAEDYDVLALTYGARDLTISALGGFGRTGGAVTTAMVARIAMDLADCAILSVRAADRTARNKVLATTLTWAALNTTALLVDRRRARRGFTIHV
jgi:hypothetical protein